MNWRHGPLLRTVGEHDLFLVTSNSSSFGVWWPFIQGELQLTDMTVVGPLVTFCHRPGGQSFSSSDTGLHFNLAAFPTYSDGKHGTSLVQQWQLERCRRLIERREAARGAPYALAARVRTDGLFGSRYFGTPVMNRSKAHDLARAWWLPPDAGGGSELSSPRYDASVFKPYEECLHHSSSKLPQLEPTCAARHLQPERERLVRQCKRHIQQMAASRTECNDNAN